MFLFVDETCIPLNSEVAGKVGATNLSYLTGTSSKAQVIVLACTWYALPPFVIFDPKMLYLELTNGEVPGTFDGLSSN